MMKYLITAVGLLGLGCSGLEKPKVIAPERPATADAAAPGPGTGPEEDAAPPPDVWISLPDGGPEAGEAGTPPPARDVIYAHTARELLSVNPDTMEVTRIGAFTMMMGNVLRPPTVTDIAVDRNRRIVGLTFNDVLQIDAATANCTRLAGLPMGQGFNGLSWIRSDTGGPEMLVATNTDGGAFRIDPQTGMATLLGRLGAGLQSSGDLVSVQTHGTLVTLKGPGTPPNLGNDRLARIDPMTGAATVIGDVGFKEVWGLGFWKNRVFGFTRGGAFILIDPRTGAGTLVRNHPLSFYGAGVTTEALVVVVD